MPPPETNRGRRAKPTILVADDQPDLLSLLTYTLESEGFQVRTAANGQEALDSIRHDPPDIAVLDLMMPVKDGFDVCREIREDPILQHLPVIILSASATKASKVEGLNIGADDFISKPVEVAELMARIRMIIRRTNQGLDANPLTHLPGNVAIESRVERALQESRPIAVLYIDLNQFKAFNDAYGYDAGDHVIKETGQLLIRISRDDTDNPHFVGHIGGDDFIYIAHPRRMEDIAKRVIREFDELSPSFYNAKDRARGKIVSTDRQGVVKEFPLLSISIGICHNQNRKLHSYAQVSQLGAELKKHAKEKAGSAYTMDRRNA